MHYTATTLRGTFDLEAAHRELVPLQSCSGASDVRRLCDHRRDLLLGYLGTPGTTSASVLM